MNAEDLPDAEWLSTDWGDGSATITTRLEALKYIALYGPRETPWRAATPEEVHRAKTAIAEAQEAGRRR